jgi:hypothetical protein
MSLALPATNTQEYIAVVAYHTKRMMISPFLHTYTKCIILFSRDAKQVQRANSSVLHVLFHIDAPLDISAVISVEAIKAAINMTDVCIQHAAYLAGRGDVDDLIQELTKGCNTSLTT